MFINNNEITKSDLDDFIKSKGLEVFTSKQVDDYLDSESTLISKSDFNELNDLEKGNLNLLKSNLESLTKWIVDDWDEEREMVVKSIMYTRPKQVDIIKSEDGNIEKMVYLDTELNRSLERVGNEIVKSKVSE